MEATTAAAIVICVTCLMLCAGVIGWAIRDRKAEKHEQRVIDLRDRIDSTIAPPPRDTALVGRHRPQEQLARSR